jgi:zinc protease
LTRGESSRLYRALVDQQLAIEVQSSHEITLDPFMFTFTVQPRQGVPPERVEQALYAEIEKLKSAGVDQHELQKARNQAIANHYRILRSINRRANQIGRYEVFFGDYHKLANVEQEINKVTAADVQRAAREYFDVNNRTVATLVPDAAAQEKSSDGSAEENQ